MRHVRIILGVAALACLAALGGCKDRSISVSPEANIRVTDLRDGFGAKAEEGKLVHVHYTARVEGGEEVINTYERRRVHKFIIGDGSVIPGMDRGVIGMRAGAKRRLVMPPAAHYGRHGYAGKIPAGATLIIEVEMMRVRNRDGVSGGELHPSDPRRRHFGQHQY